MFVTSKSAEFISVFLVVLILSVAVTFILPEKYAGTCRIMDNVGTYLADPGQNSIYSPFFTKRLFKIIQSPAVLTNVIHKLDLNHRWGVTFSTGGDLSTQESLAVLRQNLVLTVVPGRWLIAITYYSENKNEAAEIANAMAEAYQDYWANERKQMARKSLQVLEQQAMESEAKIQAATTNLEFLRCELGIMENDKNTQSFSVIQDLQHQVDQAYGKQLAESENILNQLATQLAKLKALAPGKLREVLPSVTGDATLSNLLANLEAAKHAAATTTNNGAQILELNLRIDRRIEGIMLGLESEVASKKDNLKVMKEAIAQARKINQEEAERTQPFWKERCNLEQVIKIHNLLTKQIEFEKSLPDIPKTAWVAIVEPAVPGKVPVKPNKPLYIATGGIAGLLLAWLSARRVAKPSVSA